MLIVTIVVSIGLKGQHTQQQQQQQQQLVPATSPCN